MKKVVLIFLIAISYPCTGQTSRFQKIIGDTGSVNLTSSIDTTFDGGFILGGYWNDGGSSYLIKTDANGNIQWKKEYDPGFENMINNVIQTKDSGFIFTGMALRNPQMDGDIQLVKTDKNGNITWSKTYNVIWSSGASQIIEDQNSFLVIGEIDPANINYTSGLLFFRVDYSGNLLWSTDLHLTNQNYYTFGSVVTKTNDNNYMTAGSCDFGGASKYFLVKFDIAGNVMMNLTLDNTADFNESPVSIYQFPNNDFIIGGFDVSGMSFDNIRAFRMDQTGTVIWSKKYFVPGMLCGYPRACTNRKGETVFTADLRDTATGKDLMYALMIDENGNIERAKIYGDSTLTCGTNVVPSRDEGWAFSAGIYFPTTCSFMVKTDSLLQSGCEESDVTFVQQDISLVPGNGGSISHNLNQYSYSPVAVSLDTSSITFCFDRTQADSIVIPSTDNFFIPNAFTPNGDGLNDIFIPFVPESENYHFMIFDRWGELIFETNDVNKGWDGTLKNNKCELGVYVWKIDYVNVADNSNQEGIGHVSLIR